MAEPTITCPKCKSEIKLTESLAAPLIESTRLDFEKRLAQYSRLRQENPDFLASIWWDEMSRLFAQLKENGRIDFLDNHLGKDGLDITLFPPMPKKK